MNEKYLTQALLSPLMDGKEITLLTLQDDCIGLRIEKYINKFLRLMEQAHKNSQGNPRPEYANIFKHFERLKGRRVYYLPSTEDWAAALVMPPAGELPKDYTGALKA